LGCGFLIRPNKPGPAAGCGVGGRKEKEKRACQGGVLNRLLRRQTPHLITFKPETVEHGTHARLRRRKKKENISGTKGWNRRAF